MTALPVRLLGPVAVEDRDGRSLALGPARQRAVLAALLLDAGRPVCGSDLIARVWGELAPPGAEQALRSYLCRLRKAVEASPWLRLARRNGGYEVTAERLDLTEFRGLVGRARVAARDARHDEALDAYGQALDLAQGDVLVGVGSDWLDERRRQLERERHQASLERNDLALAIGAVELVVSDAPSRLAIEPYDERLAGQAMLALAGVGRTAEALQVFEQVRERLVEELGIDPGSQLRAVQLRVLQGVEPATGRRGRPFTTGLRAPVPRQLPPPVRGFVDREAELRTLDRLLLGGGDEPRSVVVCGPGGAGKTALVVHWARQHADAFPDGQLWVDLHGFDPGVEPTAPETALRRLLVALGLDPAGVPTELADMVACYRTLLADRRVLLVADDVGTVAQVRPLLPPGSGSAAMVTSRSGLPGLVANVGAPVLPVGLLDRTAAEDLLARRIGEGRTAAEPDAVERLLVRCDGLPLALSIVAGRAAAVPSLPLAALADELEDDRRRLAALCSGERGSDLEAVITGSVAVLSPTARSVLAWLAAGPRVDIRPPLVAALADLSETRTAEVMRELIGLHVLEPDGPERCRLHDLVRLAARAQPSPGLDAALDRLVRFLINERMERGHDPSDLLAAFGYASESGRDEVACDLADALEVPLGSTGRWSELVAVNDQAIEAARRLDDDLRRAAALIGRGRGRIGQRAYDQAERDLTDALGLGYDGVDLGLRARAHRALARLAAHRGQWHIALHHDECGLAISRERGDVLTEAHAYNAIGWHRAHLGQAADALESCRRGLLIFLQHGDRSGEALTQDSIGFALERLGRLDEARDAYRRGAQLCRELGWQVVLTNTLLRLAEVSRRVGDDEKAETARAEAEEILRLTGRDVLEP